MIKSILVALDDSKSSEFAKKLTIQFSKSYKASVTGIGIVDDMWIAAPEAIPLGGAAFKVELDEQLLQTAKRRVHKLEKAFVEECQSEAVTCSVIDVSGIPEDQIEHFITEHDLLIIGKDTNFHSNPSLEVTGSVNQLIKDNPRPVIVTSPSLPHQSGSNVLVAFDGSLASSRALHMALLLGIFKGKKVHIANVSSNEKLARDKLASALKLCQNHGIQAEAHPLVSSQKPSKALLDLMEELKPSLVVMGAYGHSGLSYFFSGSCAKDLLNSTEIPLFVYH